MAWTNIWLRIKGKWRWWLFIGGLALGAFLNFFPSRLVQWINVGGDFGAAERTRFAIGILTFLGAGVAAALYFWRNLITGKQANAALLNARTAQKAQTSTDLAKAYELLGEDKMSVRLGAIYTLEKVARDIRETDPDLYWSIIETLCGHARERSKEILAEIETLKAERREAKREDKEAQENQAAEQEEIELADTDYPSNLDIVAIITVIGRRKPIEGEKIINLQGAFARKFSCSEKELNLSWIDLMGAEFEGAYLKDAQLEGAYLEGAKLKGADLKRAKLKGADLKEAQLQGADLKRADLKRAYLKRAQLQGADLKEAQLEGAYLKEAQLERADLQSAYLNRAKLDGAQLEGAHLLGVYLQGARLEGAKELTQDQINWAFGDADTSLPENLTAPQYWGQSVNEQFEAIFERARAEQERTK